MTAHRSESVDEAHFLEAFDFQRIAKRSITVIALALQHRKLNVDLVDLRCGVGREHEGFEQNLVHEILNALREVSGACGESKVFGD